MTGKELPEMAELGKIYSKNITHDPLSGIGKWTDGELYSFMRTGIKPDGQYVPIYMPKFPLMSDEDLKSVIAWLRSDSYPVQGLARSRL
jgi:cytochrome c2